VNPTETNGTKNLFKGEIGRSTFGLQIHFFPHKRHYIEDIFRMKKIICKNNYVILLTTVLIHCACCGCKEQRRGRCIYVWHVHLASAQQRRVLVGSQLIGWSRASKASNAINYYILCHVCCILYIFISWL
jgi:hypothetical protein